MGSRLVPNYACLFMRHVEEQIFAQYTGTNVYTRAHFSLRTQITSNSNFYRYVTRTIYSCLFPLMKRQQPRNVW